MVEWPSLFFFMMVAMSKRLLVVVLLLLAAGCNRQSASAPAVTKEDTDFVQQLLARLAAHDLPAVESYADPR